MKIVLLEGLGVSDHVIQAERSRNADVIMLANMPLAPSVLEETKSLKFIDVAFTGVNHIPMAEAKKRGIAVSNASGYATQAVAELCIRFMIQLLRNVNKTEERCRNGGTKEGLVGHLLWGKTVDIVGAGAIGKRVAALCKAFGCTVLAYNKSTVSDPAIDEQVSLEVLLNRADIVSLHCPLTADTKGMIGREQLALLKKSALLINTARGGVLDAVALAEALENGSIAGAACDVFETEPPLTADHPLLHCPNTIVTPHIAFASVESMEQRADIVFNNLYAWLDGKQIHAV